MATEAPEELRSRPPARRYDGKKVTLAFGAFLLVGTIIASTIAYFGHQLGAVTRERYEAARAAEEGR
jgi:hypothetical protein